MSQNGKTSRFNLAAALRVSLPILLFGSCVTVRLPEMKIERTQEEKSFGWKEAAGLARENNPDILAARAALKSAKYARNIAAGDYLPSVDGTLTKSRTDTTTAQPADSLGIGIEANQNLFSGFGTTGNVLEAQKNYAAQKWIYKLTSATVRSRLRLVYVELLRLQRLLEVNRSIADRRDDNAELIRLRYEAGREDLGSSLRANAILDQALFEVRQTERRIETQSLRFGRETGGNFIYPVTLMDDFEKIIPSPAAEQPDYVEIASRAPQVMRLVKAAESAKAAVISAQSAFWPQIDGTYEYGYSGVRASDLDRESFLGLQISIPFFNGGKNTQAVLKAKADYDTAWENARSARDEAVTQLSEAWAALVDSLEQVKVQKSFVEASRKRSEIVREKYSSGLSDYQEFDITEDDLTQSEKNYVQSLANALITQANWELLKGSTLEDVLNEA